MALRGAALALTFALASGVAQEEDCALIQHATREISLEHEKQNQQKDEQNETSSTRSDDYMFDLNLRAGPGVTISGDPFDTDHGSTSGCGAGNSKCTCTYDHEGFRMRGYGTEGTMTGLEFDCKNIKFSMPGYDPDGCTCSFHAMINYWGRGRALIQTCKPACYKFSDYDGQGKGRVSDLARFDNPNGGGEINAVSWEFHIQADALGEAKPKKPTQVIGGWGLVSSGASTQITQSVTWSSTETKATANEVSESITVGTKFTYSESFGIEVPEVGKASESASAEVSLSSTTAWKMTITDTMSKTNGGTQTFVCTPEPCQGGTSFQWQTSVNTMDTWGALFDSCIFVCMPNQGQQPKCPYGSCCTKDKEDQCSKCSDEWCDKSDPNCPFSDPSFKPGCD